MRDPGEGLAGREGLFPPACHQSLLGISIQAEPCSLDSEL